MAIFFVQSIAIGSWFPRIPEMQSALGLGPAELALALLGMPIGLLLTLPFAGAFVARVGARATIIGGFALFLLFAPLPALAWNLPSLFFALLIVGTIASGLELGLNVAADAIEHQAGRKIMSTCHGFWSLGQMVGSLVGVGFAAIAMPVSLSLATVSLLLIGPALWLGVTLPPLAGSSTQPAGEPQVRRGPSKALIGLCLFVLGIAMAEGAAADWSAVFLRDVIGAPLAVAGFGYTVYAFAIAAGRFLGDSLSTRFGPVALARFCGAVTIIGIGIVITSAEPVQTMIGLAALGFGCSVGFPLGVTAAARLGDRPAARNVALLSLFALFGFLLGPPMIGFVGEHLGLRYGLAMLLPALGLSLILAAGLRPRRMAGELVGIGA